MGRSVLIIDDSDSVRADVKRVLAEGGLFDEYYEAVDGVDGFKLLLNKDIDIILCDIVMPGIDGFKFLAMKRGKPELLDIPVIMLTGQEDVRLKVRGLEQGANDYLVKPVDPAELLARVRVHLKLKSLQDELRQKNLKLEELSNTDGLTKIYNRRYFMEMYELEFLRAKRFEHPLSFLMIDIDHFKKFNDTYGHMLGDTILVEVAGILNENLRRLDVIGRYGGEEFSIFMPETDLDGALVVAERHRREVEQFVRTENGKTLHVTISIGVACMKDGELEYSDNLIKLADDALYLAKQNGRNRVEVAGG